MGMNQKRVRTAMQANFQAGRVKGRGKVRNVSEGGLFVGTSAIPEEGEMALVSIQTPTGNRLAISGLVWWTTSRPGGSANRAPGFGLRVLDDSQAYRNLVETLLR
jgi:Tfp pilus assembly protein PilZ